MTTKVLCLQLTLDNGYLKKYSGNSHKEELYYKLFGKEQEKLELEVRTLGNNEKVDETSAANQSGGEALKFKKTTKKTSLS